MLSNEVGIILLILLSVLSALVVFILALFLYINVTRTGRLRLNEDGVRDLSYHMIPGGPDDESDAELSSDISSRRARDWQKTYPPSSLASEITLSQFLTIQEKGVQAWSFEPDFIDVATTNVLVSNRTECTFLETDEPCAVLSNLPLPKFVNHIVADVVYWEVKLFDLPDNTHMSVGLATKPWPSFRMPGWNRFSVAYHLWTGNTSYNSQLNMFPYGPSLREGDVIGVGYRAKTGTVFFTKNGKKMPDAFAGLLGLTLFPCIGADGPTTVHVNLGQMGFVFIEANVKKWGLAPMQGTLAPPPAYGKERGSILLEGDSNAESSSSAQSRQWVPSRPSPLRQAVIATTPESSDASQSSSQPSSLNVQSQLSLSQRRRSSLVPPSSLPYSIAQSSVDEPQSPEILHTLNPGDISLSSLRQNSSTSNPSENAETNEIPMEQPLPPGYASIDPITYAQGLNFEVPAEMLLRME